MPQSPVTPQSHRPSNKHSSESTPTKQKPTGSRATSGKVSKINKEIDIGPRIGSFDTANVREKIRKWQVEGGGVVPADDNIRSDDDAQDVDATPKSEASVKSQEPAPSAPSSEPKVAEIPKKEDSGTRNGKGAVHNELSRDIKIAIAPRKRVVSDGHWVRHKTSSRVEAVPAQSPKHRSPKPNQPAEHTEATNLKKQTSPSSSGLSAKRQTSKSTPADEGIRVHRVTPSNGYDHRKTKSTDHGCRQDSHGKKSRSSSQGSASSNSMPTPMKVRSSTRRSSRRVSPVRSQDDKEEQLESSAVPDSSPRLVKKRRGPESKSEALKKKQSSDKVESASPAQIANPSPSGFGNRIEAWLTATPDPFLEDDEPSPNPVAKSRPERLEKSPRKSKNKDECQTPARRKRSKHSSEDEQIVVQEEAMITKNASEGSPTQSKLKRSGAKRNPSSPDRERQDNQAKEELVQRMDDGLTVTSSSVDPSAEDAWEDLPVMQHALSRRRFPTTGQRLSTIASVETFHARHHQGAPPSISEASENTAKPAAEENNMCPESRDTFDPNSVTGIKGRDGGLKRKMTTHADLISVLSLPNAGSKSIMSARSIRTNRSRLANATISDLMKELETDEMKYTRELKTLVDGVIPVLLTCVLSRSDSALAAGLFSRASPKNDPNVTKPIVDMGIALERLKATHKRIPQTNPDSFLSWAQGAHRVYADYLKAWRLGFQDVVVNLAPAAEEVTKSQEGTAQGTGWDEGLPRNEEGYVVNGDGERVDVAFLLKRPLVRLKYLAKTLKGINTIKPSQQAEELATRYQELVVEARKRSNEERARLEDEAAASIDSTRARDPKTLAPLAGVSVDQTRCVTARDYFDMNLRHSSGQLLDCKIEMLIREDDPNRGNSGDVLVCEVSSTGRWLLFPPVECSRISARNGDAEGEIVVMIRGLHSGGQEWQELMCLTTQDEQTGFEWVQMLGLKPIPPELPQKRSFESKVEHISKSPSSRLEVVKPPSAAPLKSRTPSPRQIEVPIGEQSKSKPKDWDRETSRSAGRSTPRQRSPSPTPRKDGVKRSSPRAYEEPYFYEKNVPENRVDAARSSISESAREPTVSESGSPTLKRAKAQRQSRHATLSPTTENRYKHKHSGSLDSSDPPIKEIRPSLYSHSTSSTVSSSKDYKVWFPPHDSDSDDSPDETSYEVSRKKSSSRPGGRDRASSVPSLDLPSIPKIRKSSQPTTPHKTDAKYDSLAEKSYTPPRKEAPSSAPSKLQKRRSGDNAQKTAEHQSDVPPPPPVHRPQKSSGLKNALASSFTPLIPGFRQHRRSSSPLKHEYEPSTASESSEESDQSGFGDDASVTSESSDDGDEDLNIATPIPPTHGLNKLKKPSPDGSVCSFPNANATLSPSQSASQAPYRTVPPQASKAAKTIASIFSWSDMGQWESIHPNECSIVITPGLIEAFELTAAHSQSNPRQDDDLEASSSEPPLVGLELTPLVPIRRGTALDISIRSPPTANSKIRSGNNIMFRSRSSEECEALYNMINQSRINNPTYIALQNARGPMGESSWAAAMERRNSQRGSGTSWWRERLGSRTGSYRASSSRTPSVAAVSESSVATMASAFSALKRFSTGGRLFNVARSTISSKDGTLSNSTASASWSSSSGSSTPVVPGMGVPPAQLGITSTKVRLYQRETASKWRDMGSARLTIMQPSRPPSAQAPGSPGMRGAPAMEKRIMLNGKTKGEVLLDVTLGESSFERVARTGIAVSVWEENRGPNGEMGHVAAKGGVSLARAKVYMIQMKSERDCAYTFSLVGKLRY